LALYKFFIDIDIDIDIVSK